MFFLFWSDKSGQTQDAIFDVVSQETHESVLAITSHPVEEGSDVTDHARAEPVRITVEGFVSNVPSITNPGVGQLMALRSVLLTIPEKAGGAPIFTPGGLTQAAGSAIGGLLGLTKSLPKSMPVLTATGPWQDRGQFIYRKLLQAQKDRARITVVATKVQSIADMLIERLAVPRAVGDAGGLMFQIDLLQIRIVTSETVDAPSPAELRGMPSTSSGSQGTKSAEDAAKKNAKQATLAAKGFDKAAAAIRESGLSNILPF